MVVLQLCYTGCEKFLDGILTLKLIIKDAEHVL